MTAAMATIDSAQIAVTRDGNTIFGVNKRFESDLTAEKLQLATSHASSPAAGRGLTRELSIANETIIVRDYLRGGLAAKVSTNKYWYSGIKNTRAYQEAMLTQWLFEQGLSVPEFAAFTVQKHLTCYTANFATVKLADTFTLWSAIEQQLTIDWQVIGEQIAKLHQLNVNHADLNAKNILLNHDARCWIIDFDKSKVCEHDTQFRQQNIDRLMRSIKKVSPDFNQAQPSWQSMLTGYNNVMEGQIPT